MNKIYSTKSFWEKYWKEQKPSSENFMFDEIITKYIDFQNVHSYMEIGGAPGSIMTYMNKKYGVSVSAIDFVDKTVIEAVMQENKVTDYTIYQEDFFDFKPEEHARKYNIVASWGFIEHFDLVTCKSFIKKQKELVSDGGYLIVELPNIRKFNWIIYRVFNNDLLKIHNIKTMDIHFLKNEILLGEQFELLYCNYYLTSFLGFNSSNDFFDKHYFIKKIFGVLQSLSKILKIDNIGNKFFSPYIVIIAKRIKNKEI